MITLPGNISRQSYRGLMEIVRFNWHFYAIATVIMVGVLGSLPWMNIGLWWRVLVASAVGLSAAWTLLSLVVSHVIYDRSDIYELGWLRQAIDAPHVKWISIHAGFDKTSDRLRQLFPGIPYEVLDIYNPAEMHESSIARARRYADATSATVDFRNLPLKSSSCDAAFLVLSIHEIRQPEARLEFFRDLHRVLRPGASVVLIEHLRDVPNCAAFGPGFFHFHTRGSWIRATSQAGFSIVHEQKHTPFVRCFVFRRLP